MGVEIEDMVQFMVAFTGDSSPVDDVPFAHESELAALEARIAEAARQR